MSETSPYANSVFEQPWWLDIVAPGRWSEATVCEGETNNVIARLPYVYQNNKVALPHYTQTLGIWMDDSLRFLQRGNDHLSRQKEIIHELMKQLPPKREIDIVLDTAQQYVLPFRWEGYSIEPFFSYRITDLSDESTTEAHFSKNVRRDINRGKKTLYIDNSSSSIEEFITLQNLTYSRQNRKNPIDNAFTFEVIKKALGIGHGKLLIARDEEGIAHAGSFILYDEKVCYHLMSGQDTSFGNDCAMPFLMHNEILFAGTVSKVFDFEGSMVEGIEQVYRRYGGEQVITWHVAKRTLLKEVANVMKPRVKRLIGYKM